MKNFFRVFLVGMILLGLSGLAGAEEWKQYDLTKVVELKVSVPLLLKIWVRMKKREVRL